MRGTMRCPPASERFALEDPGEGVEQDGAISSPGAAVHAGQRERLEPGEAIEQLAAPRPVRVIVYLRAHGLARPQDVALGERRVLGAGLREEVAAQERLR